MKELNAVKNRVGNKLVINMAKVPQVKSEYVILKTRPFRGERMDARIFKMLRQDA